MHGYADGLSRLPLTAVGDENPYEDVSVFNKSQIESCPVVDSEIRCATLSDSVSNVLKFTQQGWPREVSAELAPFRNRAVELTIESDCLLWGHSYYST